VTIRVVLADDHPVVRDGFAALLESIPGIEVVGVAANGHEALRAAVTLRPDVLVMDVQMPEMDGATAAREVRRAAPSVGILMLSMYDDSDSVRAALRAGALGYVLKGATQQQIVRAIETVADGDSVLGAGVAPGILERAGSGSTSAPSPFAALTARELEILDLLAAGLPTARIASRLGLAMKTVNNNASTICAKLGVTGRTEAALLARQHGLGDDARS
jgi:DNA-binding NarL/FixJ family response regulator